MNSLSRPNALIVFLIAAFAFALVLFATAKWGIGISADSTVYLGAARTLMEKGSLQDIDPWGRSVPLVHSAPLFSVVLAGISSIFRMDPFSAARWLGAVCFFLNIAILGIAAGRRFQSPLLGITAALLALVASPMVDLHLMALSEPLYLVLSLSALLFLLTHLERSDTLSLVFAAVLSALAILTRYAGAALLGAEVLALLLLSKTPLARRLSNVVIFSLLSGLPFAAWLYRNTTATGSATTGRLSADHIAGLKTVSQGVATVTSWLLPGGVPLPIRIAVFVVLAAGLVFASRAGTLSQDRPLSKIPELMGLFIFCHVALCWLAISFVYNDIPLDDRNLLPALCPGILCVLWVQNRLRTAAPSASKMLWIPVAATLVLFALTNTGRSAVLVSKTSRLGRGYSSREWRNSLVIQRIRSLDPKIPVYSSLPSAVHFLTGSLPRGLPKTYDDRNTQRNLNFADDIKTLRAESESSGIAVIYFGKRDAPWFHPERQFREEVAVVPVVEDSVGSLSWSPQLNGRH